EFIGSGFTFRIRVVLFSCYYYSPASSTGRRLGLHNQIPRRAPNLPRPLRRHVAAESAVTADSRVRESERGR
ncbi:hypothetical protein BHE74_00056877, partial [Ensete ventricosum]